MVDEEPEFIYVNGDVKLSDSYSVLKTITSDSPLYGQRSDSEKIRVDEWIEFCKSLEVPVSVLVWLATGNLSRDAVPVLAEKKARSDIMLSLRKLEVALKETPYLTGDNVTIADIIIGCCLRPLFMLVFGEVERKNNPCLCAWISKLYASPMFLETVGETTLLVGSKKG
ncbi:hypothetical protein WA171_005943, partial [Blastocystis sp. BT1]